MTCSLGVKEEAWKRSIIKGQQLLPSNPIGGWARHIEIRYGPPFLLDEDHKTSTFLYIRYL